MDYYAEDKSSWEVVRMGFEQEIYPRLPNAHQFVIPTTIAFFPKNDNKSQKHDQFCTENAAQVGGMSHHVFPRHVWHVFIN